MSDDETLNLANIAGGAALELFDRELQAVLKNIADVNTDAERPRAIAFEFVFKPFPDRSGFGIELKTRSKLVSSETVKAQAFLSRAGGRLTAFPHDPRQTRLFSRTEGMGDGREPN